MKHRDPHVLRLHAAREPPAVAISWTPATRFSMSAWPSHYGIEGVKGAEFRRVELDHRPARRHAQPGQRAHRLQLPHAHLGGDSREVYPATTFWATPPPRRRPTFRRSTKPPSAPPPPCASRWRSTAPTPCAPPATPRWTRSASAWRTTTASASGAPWTANFPWMPAARCPTARPSPRPRRNARRARSPLLRSSARCMVEKMMTYSLGRGHRAPTTGAPWMKSPQTGGANGYPFQSLIYEIVRSLPFQMRRGEADQPERKNRRGNNEVARK